jgi:murein DD-endopeptidase MepM/ murein hydrolase activator NlpD
MSAKGGSVQPKGGRFTTIFTGLFAALVGAAPAPPALAQANDDTAASGHDIVLDFAGALRELHFQSPTITVTHAGVTSHFDAPLTRLPELAAGVIRTSLFEAAGDAHVPEAVLAEMTRAFSYDIDFQRDLQPNDSFEILYERLYDARGKAAGIGDIIYAAMTLSGRTHRLYRYRPAGAQAPEFFTDGGQSVKKALLRTPIDGARLSSAYGMRLHPILGYTKIHRGVDFAAPRGTPIMAASDGVVEEAGRKGAYGNFVLIRHDGVYETAYAHLRRFARGLRPGTPVRQGEVIGFVGATGRATGPHLHFEVRARGEQVNPMSVRTAAGPALAGGELAAFSAAAKIIDREVQNLRAATLVASVPFRRTQP